LIFLFLFFTLSTQVLSFFLLSKALKRYGSYIKKIIWKD